MSDHRNQSAGAAANTDNFRRDLVCVRLVKIIDVLEKMLVLLEPTVPAPVQADHDLSTTSLLDAVKAAFTKDQSPGTQATAQQDLAKDTQAEMDTPFIRDGGAAAMALYQIFGLTPKVGLRFVTVRNASQARVQITLSTHRADLTLDCQLTDDGHVLQVQPSVVVNSGSTEPTWRSRGLRSAEVGIVAMACEHLILEARIAMWLTRSKAVH